MTGRTVEGSRGSSRARLRKVRVADLKYGDVVCLSEGEAFVVCCGDATEEWQRTWGTGPAKDPEGWRVGISRLNEKTDRSKSETWHSEPKLVIWGVTHGESGTVENMYATVQYVKLPEEVWVQYLE